MDEIRDMEAKASRQNFPPEIDPIRELEIKSMGAQVAELAHLRNLLSTLAGMMVVDDINRKVIISYNDLYSTPQTEKLLHRLRKMKAEGGSL